MSKAIGMEIKKCLEWKAEHGPKVVKKEETGMVVKEEKMDTEDKEDKKPDLTTSPTKPGSSSSC